MSPLKNTKGFTLFELLIVVFLLAMLATAALSGFIGSQDSFNFFAQQKDVSSTLRTLRTFAVTNKEMRGPCGDGADAPLPASAERYSAEITADSLTIYADTCAFGAYGLDAMDPVIKEIDFSDSNFRLQVLRSGDLEALDFPVNLSYERGSGEFSVRGNGVLLPKDQYRYVALRFYQLDGDLEDFTVILQVSGLPENFSNIDSLR